MCIYMDGLLLYTSMLMACEEGDKKKRRSGWCKATAPRGGEQLNGLDDADDDKGCDCDLACCCVY